MQDVEFCLESVQKTRIGIAVAIFLLWQGIGSRVYQDFPRETDMECTAGS